MEIHIHIAPGQAQTEPIHVTLPESMVSGGSQTSAAVALQPSAPPPPSEPVPAPVLALVPQPVPEPAPEPAPVPVPVAVAAPASEKVLERTFEAKPERDQPAPIEYTDCEIVCDDSDRGAWLLARKDSVGASEAAPILGLEGAYGSGLSVYAGKRTEVEDTPQEEPQLWGTLLEPVVLAEYARRTGRELFPGGKLLRNLERPWQSCTLDAAQRVKGKPGPGGVEVKCTSWKKSEWDDGVPATVNAQIQHQMAVTGWQWTTVVVLFFGNEMKWLDVERDDTFINDILIPAERKFWDSVEAGTPPDPDDSKASYEAIKRLWPTPEPGTVVDLHESFLSRDEARTFAANRIKRAEVSKRGAENAIKAAIGEAEAGRLTNGVVFTYKKNSKGDRRLNRVAAKEKK